MQTVEELNSEAEKIQQRLKQIEDDKLAAAEREREGKISLIGVLESEARGFRQQAEKATNEPEKRALYGFANKNDQDIIELKKELGLFSEADSQLLNELYTDSKTRIIRRMNSLVVKAVSSLILFFLSEFFMRQIDAGFFHSTIRTLGHVCYFLAAGFGGFWVVVKTFNTFLSDYIIDELEQDFTSLSPFQKLILLSSLAGGMFILLNAVMPHAE